MHSKLGDTYYIIQIFKTYLPFLNELLKLTIDEAARMLTPYVSRTIISSYTQTERM